MRPILQSARSDGDKLARVCKPESGLRHGHPRGARERVAVCAHLVGVRVVLQVCRQFGFGSHPISLEVNNNPAGGPPVDKIDRSAPKLRDRALRAIACE